MNTSLITTTPKEEKEKKQLQQSIFRKKKVLETWTEKVEMLKMDLELIKNEYTVRIGYLLLKDNQLDLEIIQYRNLKRLMDEGMTYEEAMKAEEDTFYNEILRMQKEQERLEQEKSFFEKRQEVPEEVQIDVKTLWKKLIRKFHPDLVAGQDEKRKREKLMKQINKAYAEGNLHVLQQLENDGEVEDMTDTTKEKLEAMLVQTENLIQSAKRDFQDLRLSEWYIWKKRIDKAKRSESSIDVFAELEKKILDDVVQKIAIIQELRAEVNSQALEKAT